MPGRRLQHLYPYLPSTDDARCSDDPTVRAAIGARLHAKRARWLELWSTCVDMISAFSDEHARCALDDADWAAHAAVQMHHRLAELMWTAQTEHRICPTSSPRRSAPRDQHERDQASRRSAPLPAF